MTRTNNSALDRAIRAD